MHVVFSLVGAGVHPPLNPPLFVVSRWKFVAQNTKPKLNFFEIIVFNFSFVFCYFRFVFVPYCFMVILALNNTLDLSVSVKV